DLAKQSQSQRLNLKAKLEDLNLTQDERQQAESQLANIETREESIINQLKSRDNADLKTYEDSLQRDAAARFNTARTAAMSATNDKLKARQKQMNDQLHVQLSGLGTQYQAQVANANAQLEKDPKARAEMDKIHSENQAQYAAEFSKALAAYQETRKQLVAKYSAIGHMQFIDDVAIQNETQDLAAQRRDLYGKILTQVQTQVGDVARQRGIAIVFTNIRGAGSAVDLTDQVIKAVAALPAPPSPADLVPATSSPPSPTTPSGSRT
ncbi:MAG TPA: OmpH family outer membrane protein, partial [Magnetospirillaceae bacterium]|nr:OmpH family outer membrane protein [Magnetospirillaceae bacterium]